MRSFFLASAIALGLSACASQSAPSAAPAAAAAPKAPQCFNGDTGKFDAVGVMTTIAGVKVACEKTSDGKHAQWMGVKAK